MTGVDNLLFARLQKSGLDPNLIPGFIRSLANAFLVNPGMTHTQANQRLKYLGWYDIEVDYHTLQLARSSFESKGLAQLEYRPAPWYTNRFNSAAGHLENAS